MINYAQHNSLSRDKMLTTFRTLLKYGAKFDKTDSNGLTVLEHAIMKNNEDLVAFILANKEAGIVVNHHEPIQGRTAVHICVKPLAFGSYENVKILGLLHEHGYDLNARDNQNKTPMDYAMEQDSKLMAKELCKKLQTMVDLSVSLRRNSVIPDAEWPQFEFVYEDDAAAFLDEAEQKRAKEVFEKE